ncbi:THO2 plays a role in transcriptional elongation [Malassezia psittaci]|uniref:THO complex subunit 2 n=1 Tax=Malassezia psittaci TaxID=1821823 RepID=A0AAF0F7R3_9BASI|nr:THO2 plays a role in transcriptional elongation [Malassezia psittaci]
MPIKEGVWLPSAVGEAVDQSQLSAIREKLQSESDLCTENVLELLRNVALQGSHPAEAVASVLSGEGTWPDKLLDLFWAIDWELDARLALHRDDGAEDDVGDDKEVSVPMSAARARLASVLSQLVAQGTLTRELLCLRLDPPLLAAAQFVHAQSFSRRAIQIRTASFFKQQKYNLIREENEGYSALINELVIHRGPPVTANYKEESVSGATWTAPYTICEQESSADRDARAFSMLQNITALVGYFRLDSIRVLDLTLAVFAMYVVHHSPFFLSLLRQSRWKSDQIAAVLGMQYAYFVLPDTREDTPEELYTMTGLLLRHKLVTLEELTAYIAPDGGYAALKAKYQDAVAEKAASVGANALTMAAPLANDEDPETGKQSETRDDTFTPKDTPVQLLHVLRASLAVGAVDLVRPVLVEHPWIFGASPSLTAIYLRLAEHMISPVMQHLSLANSVPDTALGHLLPARNSTKPPALKLTLYAPEPYANVQNRFVYFVPDWAKDIIQCEDAQAVIELALPFIAPVGAQIGQSLPFIQMLCRLTAAHWLKERQAWLALVRTQLLPGISLAESNAALLHELWTILCQMPYTDRFQLYGEWKHRAYKKLDLKFRKSETEREARGILRRVSADNVRSSGRSLAKASHPNPTIFFAVVLHQIQSYDNLIEPVVDAAKYLTPVEYDIFSFSLIEALSNPEKDRTKSDGTNTSLWLKSLAAFAGAFYKKYPAMECTPLLQYLTNRLKNNHVKDLIVFSELIQKMAGIEPIGELSEQQIAALTGGVLLQSEAAMTHIPTAPNAGSVPTAILVARTMYKKGGARLLATLLSSHLALPILILMAQQRQACVFLDTDAESHIKSLASTFDHVQETLFQYVHFLVSTMTADSYASLVPSPEDLCRRFGLEATIAFHLTRPKLAYAVKVSNLRLTQTMRYDPSSKKKDKGSASPVHGKDNDMLDGAAPTQAQSVENATDAHIDQKAQEEMAVDDANPKQATPSPEQGESHNQDTITESQSIEVSTDESKLAKESEMSQEAETSDAAHDGSSSTNDKQGATSTRTDLAPQDIAQEDVTNAVAAAKNLEDNDVEMTDVISGSLHDSETSKKQELTIWQPALVSVIEGMKQILSTEILNAIGAPFYVTFWQLSLCDIVVPMDRYQQEISRLRQWLRDVEQATDLGESLKVSARVRLQDTIAQLTQELKEQTLAHQATRRRLQLEKQHYFADGADRGCIAQQLISECLHPRALLSPVDAMFAAKFLRTLHLNGTRNLPTLAVYDAVFRQHVAPTLFAATENEARNYARFLAGVLHDTQSWLLSEDIYAREALGENLPGFRLSWQGMRGMRKRDSDQPLTWYAYRGIVLQWHQSLCDAFSVCLSSDEYMRIRNAIVVLNRVSAHFPLYEQHGKQLEASVDHLIHTETRGDLKVLAQGLAATLRKRASEWVGLACFTYVVPEKQPVETPIKPQTDSNTKPGQMSKETTDLKTENMEIKRQGNTPSTSNLENAQRERPSRASRRSKEEPASSPATPIRSAAQDQRPAIAREPRQSRSAAQSQSTPIKGTAAAQSKDAGASKSAREDASRSSFAERKRDSTSKAEMRDARDTRSARDAKVSGRDIRTDDRTSRNDRQVQEARQEAKAPRSTRDSSETSHTARQRATPRASGDTRASQNASTQEWSEQSRGTPVHLRIRGSDRSNDRETHSDPRAPMRDDRDRDRDREPRTRVWGRRNEEARPAYAERDRNRDRDTLPSSRGRDNGWETTNERNVDRTESNARWDRRRNDSWRSERTDRYERTDRSKEDTEPTMRREDDDRMNSRKRSLADRLTGTEASSTPNSPNAPPKDTPDTKRKKTERNEDRWGSQSGARSDRWNDRERDRRRRRAGGDH